MQTLHQPACWLCRCQESAQTQHGEVLHTKMSNDLHIIAPCVVSIRSDSDVIAARMAARDAARKMGFSTIDQARIATVTSELSRNIMTDTGEGNVTISQIQRGDLLGIEIVFQNEGAESANGNAPAAEQDAANGKNALELSGSRRLMDELDVDIQVERGMVVTCRKWLR